MTNVMLDFALKQLVKCLESDLAEGFLTILLNAMKLVFTFDADFRRNIENFQGRYQFRSVDDSIKVGVVFDDGSMEVKDGQIIDAPNITVTFKDGKALMGFLLSPKPDILGGMLRQEVSPSGNLNYLMKFGFMAKRLQLMATCQA